MTKVHFVDTAIVRSMATEMQGATPIRPLSDFVLIQFPVPQAIEELEIPPASLSVAVPPDEARGIARALLAAADELDR